MLTNAEKVLLDKVLGVAGDDEKMIRTGIIKALHGVNDPARRQHLWCILPNAAKTKIRQQKKVVQLRLAGV